MRDDVAVAEAAVVAVEPEVAARDAGLRYVRDGRPGIRRELRGDSFVYIDPSGTTVDDAATLERIAALAIPLAYTDAWICPSPNGHIQATGRDAAGRKQYRYHPRWRATRDETKYGRMLAFGRALPEIRAAVSRDLRRPGLSREKVVAAVVRLLELTLIRVGNDEYARTNDSYGLTTMYDDHVTVENSTITFAFRGKSGKFHDIALRDRRLATIVRSCRDLPGQELFQYLGDDGEPHDIGSDDVNSYLRAVSGQPFSAKDFRTWAGTIIAARLLCAAGVGASETAGKRQIVATVEEVASALGNTPAVCRKCYIHPAVLEAYLDGTLIETMIQRASDAFGADGVLDDDERAVLAFLQAQPELQPAARRRRRARPPSA